MSHSIKSDRPLAAAERPGLASVPPLVDAHATVAAKR
jgi:hypothetical protein